MKDENPQKNIEEEPVLSVSRSSHNSEIDDKSEYKKSINTEEAVNDFIKKFDIESKKKIIDRMTYTGSSLYLFDIDNILRKTLLNIVNHEYFTLYMSFIIIANCISLIFMTIPSFNKFNQVTEIIFTCTYSLEALIKIIAFGFYFGRNTYIKNPWNLFDFIIVIAGVLGLLFDRVNSFSSFRLFMLLRPLKSTTIFSQMKTLVITLINSLIDLSSVFFLMLYFIIFFAVFGLSLWNGRFDQKCRLGVTPVHGNLQLDPDYINVLCGGSSTDCNSQSHFCQSKVKYYNYGFYFLDPRIDMNENQYSPDLNYGITTFQNIYYSLFTIFQSSTLEGWYTIMYLMIAGGSEYSAILFFVFLIFCVSFFVINLTIAVLLFNFEKYSTRAEIDLFNDKLIQYKLHKSSEKKDSIKLSLIKNKKFSFSGSRLMEEDYFFKRIKTHHIKIHKSIFSKMANPSVKDGNVHNYKRSHCFKRIKLLSEYQRKYKIAEVLYTIYYQPLFHYFINFCIVVNCVILTIENYFTNQYYIFEQVNFCIVMCFCMEKLLLIIGIGVCKFVKSVSNMWDFMIVCGSIIEIIIYNPFNNTNYVSNGKEAFFSLFKVLRIFWIFKLSRRWKSIEIIVYGLLKALVKMLDYLLFLVLFFYIYALLGYNIFSNGLKFNEVTNKFDPNSPSEFLNFDTFPQSVLSVLSIFIGYGWGDMYYSCFRSEAIEKYSTAIYFVTLLLLGNITMKNIFLAYLIQNYQVSTGLMEKNVNIKTYIQHIYLFFGNKHKQEEHNMIINSSIKIGTNDIVYDEGYMQLADRKIIRDKRNHSIKNTNFYEKENNNFNFESKFVEVSNHKELEFQFYETTTENTFSPVNTHKKTTKGFKLIEQLDDENKSMRSSSLTNKIDPSLLPRSNYVDKTERRKGLFKHNSIIFINDMIANESCMTSFIKYVNESSLFIFHKNWALSKFCKSLIENKIFNSTIISLIIIYTLSSLIDNPWNDPAGIEYKIVLYSDLIFPWIFVTEALIKIIAVGFIFKIQETQEREKDDEKKNVSAFDKFLNKHRSSSLSNMNERRATLDKKLKLIKHVKEEETKKSIPYLRQPENIIDCIVILMSLTSFITSVDNDGLNLNNFLGIRVLRSLRPIRILTRSETLKLVVKCVIKSIPSLVNISIVFGVFIYVYAVLGMNIFNSDSLYCSIAEFKTSQDCLNNGGLWINYPNNFSNIIISIRTLFILITTEGWTTIMNMQLSIASMWYTYIYFVSFIIFGYMFILNLFVTILIDHFKDIKEKETRFSELEDYEVEYVKVQHIMHKIRPKELLTHQLNVKRELTLKNLVNSVFFEYFIFSLVIIYFIIVSFQSNRSSDSFLNSTIYFNWALTILFNIEQLLKIIVYRWIYFQSGWNIFDFVIIILSDINVIISWVAPGNQLYFSGFLILIRFLRVILFLRLIVISNKLKAIFNTLLFILPTISTIGLLLLVLLTIFASIGTHIFGTVPRREYITQYNNMETFFTSVILLFRSSLGGDWNSIMEELAYHDCKNSSSLPTNTDYYCAKYNITCYDSVNYTMLMENQFSCGSDWSYPFFILFFISSAIIILNLFIVLVVEGYSDNVTESESLLGHDLVEKFVRIWLKYDPSANLYVKPYEFLLILKELEVPLGLKHDRYGNYDYHLRYHNHKKFKLFKEIIKAYEDTSSASCYVGCKESYNSYDFEGFYISKDKRYYASQLEVLKFFKKFDFPEKTFQDNSDKDQPVDCIHFVNCCIGLAENFVLKKHHPSIKKINSFVNNNFTKKIWKKTYDLDEDFIFYGESRKNNKLINSLALEILRKYEKKIKVLAEKRALFDITYHTRDLSEDCSINTRIVNLGYKKIQPFTKEKKRNENSLVEMENSLNYKKMENMKRMISKRKQTFSFNFNE